MFKLSFKYLILLAIFFVVLFTSLWSNNIYVLVFFSLLSYICLPINKYWDGVTITLLGFSILYSAMTLMTSQYGSGFILVSYLIAPVAFYRFGRWTMSCFPDDNSRQKLLFLIIGCYLCTLFFMTFKDITVVGIVNVSRVMVGDMSDGESLAATLYGLMAAVGLGSIAALFIKGQNFWLRTGYILLALLSLLVVIHLVNRTGIVIVLLCTLVTFILSSKINLSRGFFAIIILGVLSVVLVNSEILSGEVLDAYQQRESDTSVDTYQLGGRIEIWSDAIANLLTHPLGWERVRYAHNLWLDIGRIGGWITLFLFLIATFVWMKSIINLIKNARTPFFYMIISTNLSMLLASSVEPVIDGSLSFFLLLLMIWGITISMSKEITKSYHGNFIHRKVLY